MNNIAGTPGALFGEVRSLVVGWRADRPVQPRCWRRWPDVPIAGRAGAITRVPTLAARTRSTGTAQDATAESTPPDHAQRLRSRAWPANDPAASSPHARPVGIRYRLAGRIDLRCGTLVRSHGPIAFDR
jgi:hypothetical protein